jgi:catechol 2,3-dioxygenase-like lactoylglutathione lyase family enzyme
MTVPAKLAHVNLIAEDFERLIDFYQCVFGCVPVSPGGDYSAPWVAAVTGVDGASVEVLHLRLPGDGDAGPTLEIIRYGKRLKRQPTAANRPGFGHIAFAVEDVHAAERAVLAAGGGRLGEIVSVDLPGRGSLTAVYVTDPEGNIIELQRWS